MCNTEHVQPQRCIRRDIFAHDLADSVAPVRDKLLRIAATAQCSIESCFGNIIRHSAQIGRADFQIDGHCFIGEMLSEVSKAGLCEFL